MVHLRERLLAKRREGVFGIAVLLAGFAITNLCFVPIVITNSLPHSLFPTLQQEEFFFDLFGFISGCWLLCWVSAVNDWTNMARVSQWLGIILLCLDQAVMIELWMNVGHDGGSHMAIWLAPFLIQTYLAGCFFGFFTLPALTQQGNRTLTGLGTLVLLLPWLFGRDSVVAGAGYLYGFFF